MTIIMYTTHEERTSMSQIFFLGATNCILRVAPMARRVTYQEKMLDMEVIIVIVCSELKMNIEFGTEMMPSMPRMSIAAATLSPAPANATNRVKVL